MSDQALSGVLTRIDLHIFDIVEDMTVTAVGTSESSSVSTRKSGQDWERTVRPKAGEEITLSVSAGEQCFALNVRIKFEVAHKT